ncbi:hypothetical protein AMAG_11387, partial [Allomyces macrogynus ATCC 38327]
MLQQLTGTMDMESLNSALAAVAVSDDDLRQLDELDADELRALVKSAYEQVAAKERGTVWPHIHRHLRFMSTLC